MITGHEPCGVIEELSPGAPPGIKIGDRVICHHYAGCGVCENCSMGYEQLCVHGRITFGGGTGHGANADYIVVPSRSLVILDDELSLRRRSGHLLRHRHRLERTEEDGDIRPGYRGGVRAGPGGGQRDTIGQGHGRESDRLGRCSRTAGIGRGVGRGPRDKSLGSRCGGGHPGIDRRPGRDCHTGDIGQPQGAATSAGVSASLRPVLLCGHRRPGGDRLQPRRYLQGSHDLRVLDLQQGRN